MKRQFRSHLIDLIAPKVIQDTFGLKGECTYLYKELKRHGFTINNIHVIKDKEIWNKEDLAEDRIYFLNTEEGTFWSMPKIAEEDEWPTNVGAACRDIIKEGSIWQTETLLIEEDCPMSQDIKKICCYNILALQAFIDNGKFVRTGSFSGTYKDTPVCLYKRYNEEWGKFKEDTGSNTITDEMVSVHDKFKDTSMKDLAALGVNLFPNGTRIRTVLTVTSGVTLFIMIKEEDFDKIYNRE